MPVISTVAPRGENDRSLLVDETEPLSPLRLSLAVASCWLPAGLCAGRKCDCYLQQQTDQFRTIPVNGIGHLHNDQGVG